MADQFKPLTIASAAALVLAAVLPAGSSLAQLGPIPGLPSSSLGAPNGAAQLDGNARISSLQVVPAGTPHSRSIAAILGDRPSLLDFGAACDGVTDDSAAITAAEGSGKRVSIPSGLVCYGATIASATLSGAAFAGPGQIKTSDGTVHAPLFSELTVRPNLIGNWNSGNPGSAFSADLSRVVAQEYSISGAATLGQPATGYQANPSLAAQQLYVTNASGYNAPVVGGGRTGIYGRYSQVSQLGQGDLTLEMCSGNIQTTLPGATSWLQSPAVECYGGQLLSFVNGAYIEFLGDMNIADSGYDIAASGVVLNYYRQNASGALSTRWLGQVQQSQGTAPLDAFHEDTGPSASGIDWSGADFTVYQLAALSMGSGGTGYQVGDVLTATGGTPVTPASTTGAAAVGSTTRIKVTAVNGSGTITTYALSNAGFYSVAPVVSYVPIPLTGGHGTGASFSGAYEHNIAIVMPPGAGGCIIPALVQSVPSRMVGVTNAVCVSANGVTLGNLGFPALTETDTGISTTVPIKAGQSIFFTGATPTVTSCGTSTVEGGSTDMAGAIDFAGSPTSCVLKFATGFAASPPQHPFCTFTPKNIGGVSVVEYGDTATTVTFAWASAVAMTGSVNYRCN